MQPGSGTGAYLTQPTWFTSTHLLLILMMPFQCYNAKPWSSSLLLSLHSASISGPPSHTDWPHHQICATTKLLWLLPWTPSPINAPATQPWCNNFVPPYNPWQQPLFRNICRLQPTKTLFHLLYDGYPILIVSNASVPEDGHSSFAWVIANKHSATWHGMGLAPGPTEDMYLGCAKAYGLLAALTFLQHYTSVFT